jgi:hypothetical protein
MLPMENLNNEKATTIRIAARGWLYAIRMKLYNLIFQMVIPSLTQPPPERTLTGRGSRVYPKGQGSRVRPGRGRRCARASPSQLARLVEWICTIRAPQGERAYPWILSKYILCVRLSVRACVRPPTDKRRVCILCVKQHIYVVF